MQVGRSARRDSDSYTVEVFACIVCGHRNPDGARFCNSCAAPLGGEQLAPREERKLVTVLFADLVGFTARAEQLDPEDVRVLLAGYHARLRGELERYGGTVEKFIGDAVMALFGAPVAHGDDPERAVRAALAIRDAIALDDDGLQVRVGVNTGEALVVVDARAVQGEAMAAGDVVNTAARIQAGADIGAVLVGERTYRATVGTIDYRPAPLLFAKGKAQPVGVWEAVRPRARLGVDVSRSTRPLVGRRRELELLTSALARAREESSVQLVTLVGEPGMGKSRLVAELLSLVEREHGFVTWRQGRSLPYGDGVLFWALGEIVKAEAGVLDSDGPAEADAKLRRSAMALMADGQGASWLSSELRPLIGLGDESQDAPAERSPAWSRFFEALAQRGPAVVVFEDLHWADDALLGFVDDLPGEVADVPLLLLVTCRPELLQRRPGWGGGKPNATTLSLAPLPDDACLELVADVLIAPIDPEVRSALLARVGGNPLYAEQYAHALAEGDDASALPDTVQGVIAARLDALPLADKLVLQDASVVGEVFWLGVIATIGNTDEGVVREGLRRLERSQFVRRSSPSSVAGDQEYAFRHVLLRDVSYGQMPRAVRARKHRATAAWLESVGRGDDLAETLAHHYARALEYLPLVEDDPELVTRVRRALRDAGDRTLALSGYAAAIRYFQAALELAPTDEAGYRAPLLLGLGRARFGHDSSGKAELQQAFHLAEAAHDPELAAQAALALRVSEWYRGDGERADHWLAVAAGYVHDAPDSRAKAEVLAEQLRLNSLAGRYHEVVQDADAALALLDRLGAEALRARYLASIGVSRVYLGDATGIEDLRLAVTAARAAGDMEQVHASMNNLSSAQLVLGDLRGAVTTYEELVAMLDRFGRDADRRFGSASLAVLRMTEGRWDEALHLADQFLAESEAGMPHYLDATCLNLRGLIRLARDDLPGATADTARALERARAADVQMLTAAIHGRATVMLAEGRPDDADALLLELMSFGTAMLRAIDCGIVDVAMLAHDLERRPQLLGALHGLAGPWMEVARQIARGDLGAAVERLSELGYPAAEAHARLRLAGTLAARGEQDDADSQLKAAVAIFERLGAVRDVREAELSRLRKHNLAQNQQR